MRKNSAKGLKGAGSGVAEDKRRGILEKVTKGSGEKKGRWGANGPTKKDEIKGRGEKWIEKMGKRKKLKGKQRGQKDHEAGEDAKK